VEKRQLGSITQAALTEIEKTSSTVSAMVLPRVRTASPQIEAL
jgi:hypothetical protein